MNRSLTLSALADRWSRPDRATTWKRGALVAVTWDQHKVFYLAVAMSRKKLRVLDHGSLTYGDEFPPLAELRDQLDAKRLRVEKLVLVVPRGQLEMMTVQVPRADDEELAALVQSEVEAEVGDGEQTIVSDYCVLEGHPGQRGGPGGQERSSAPSLANGDAARPEEGSDDHVSAVAFAMDQSRFRSWRDRAAEHGLTLVAVTSRQVAPLTSFIAQGSFPRPLTVLVAIYAGVVELSFFERHRLALLRTFRVASSTPESLAEQIQLEVQRSLSMVDFGSTDGDADIVLLQRSPETMLPEATADPDAADPDAATADPEVPFDWTEFVEGLGARSVSLPQDELETKPEAAGVLEPALLGAVLDVAHERLAVDLVHPKRPAKPPNPVRRWALIGTFAACSLLIVGYVLWSDVDQLRQQVVMEEGELEQAEAMGAKLQEQADETRYVQQWLGTQVDWLTHMQRLSEQFPDGQGANVRRLSASIENGLGVFKLSIQVSDPARVAALENRLRSAGFAVTSKQVSEQGANSEYPWQFEATVAFPLVPLETREEGLELVATEEPAVESSPKDAEGEKTPAPATDSPTDTSPAAETSPADEGEQT